MADSFPFAVQSIGRPNHTGLPGSNQDIGGGKVMNLFPKAAILQAIGIIYGMGVATGFGIGAWLF